MLLGYKGSLHTYALLVMNAGRERSAEGSYDEIFTSPVCLCWFAVAACRDSTVVECGRPVVRREGPSRDEERQGVFPDGLARGARSRSVGIVVAAILLQRSFPRSSSA